MKRKEVMILLILIFLLLISNYLTSAQDIVYGPGGIPILEIKQDAIHYFVYDEAGNLVNIVNNESEVVARYEYNPFGEPKDWSNVPDFSVSGVDEDTELYGDYDPTTEGYISPTPSFWKRSTSGKLRAVGNFLTNNAIEDWGYGGTNVDSMMDLVELGVYAEVGGQVMTGATTAIFRKLGYIPRWIKAPYKFGSRLLHGKNQFVNVNRGGSTGGIVIPNIEETKQVSIVASGKAFNPLITLEEGPSIKSSWLRHPIKSFSRWYDLRFFSKQIIDIKGIKFIPTEELNKGIFIGKYGLVRHKLGEKYIKVYMPLEGEVDKITLLHELGHITHYRRLDHLAITNPEKIYSKFIYKHTAYSIQKQKALHEAMGHRFITRHGEKLGLPKSFINNAWNEYMRERALFLAID